MGQLFAQDCFACGACLRTCPTKALRWGTRPPADEDAVAAGEPGQDKHER